MKKKMAAQKMHPAEMAFRSAMDPRRKQEIMDSRMIQEDHSAVANLSETFINHEYKAFKYAERFCDSYEGVEGKKWQK